MNGKKLFCYVIRSSSTGIVSGSSDRQLITISNEHDFVLKEIRTTGTSNLLLSLAGLNGDQWSNQSFDAGLVGAGVNGVKFFDIEYVLPAGSQIEAVFDNQTGANITTTKEIQLWGYKRAKAGY